LRCLTVSFSNVEGGFYYLRRRRSLISAQGWSISSNLGLVCLNLAINPERVDGVRA
jgi:hypothetical protein